MENILLKRASSGGGGGGGGLTATTEEKTGADCSGSDGSTNRVLTLTNTSLSSTELVTINGVTQSARAGDYTASHLSTSSTITFLGEIYNDDELTVRYYVT